MVLLTRRAAWAAWRAAHLQIGGAMLPETER